MKTLKISPYQLAELFIGTKEITGETDNPLIMAMLRLCAAWPTHDEVPWCSGFANLICHLLDLPRSEDLRARSWLNVGRSVSIAEARPGYDVVVLMRGSPPQPGPDVISAPGHVGFFDGFDGTEQEDVKLLAGNQSNAVNIMGFPADRVLGIRRLI